MITWLVAAAHEIPQELGDFGILVHSGWRPWRALAYNTVSALPFLAGGVIAYGFAGSVNVIVLVPFAAGNFIYIALADLIPQMTGQERIRDKVVHTGSFAAGLALLYVLALTAG